jgi:hypothetical protein
MSTRRPGLWLPAHSDDTDLGDALLRRHFGRPRPACHEGPLRAHSGRMADSRKIPIFAAPLMGVWNSSNVCPRGLDYGAAAERSFMAKFAISLLGSGRSRRAAKSSLIITVVEIVLCNPIS